MDASLANLIDAIRGAVAAQAPLRIRGGGSKDFYGEPTDPALAVLDTRCHSGIISYEPSELVITAKAGTPLTELEAALAEQGQCLAFEPPLHAATATVGGMVAAGLAGPARPSVGGVRDYVLGAHLVNGRAQLLEFGGQVMKNVAGYDVSRALAGSMGSLGLIAQVSLKVLPVAPCEVTLRLCMDEASAIRRCNEWAGQPLPLNASSWAADSDGPSLLLRLRGAAAAVESACTRLMRESGGNLVDSATAAQCWRSIRDTASPWFGAGLAQDLDLWRISVPQTTPPLGLGDTLVDWFGGQRWLFAPAPQRAQAAQRFRAAAQAAGGHAVLYRAAQSAATAAARFDRLDPVVARIQRALKTQFDPAGLFNPDRLGVI